MGLNQRVKQDTVTPASKENKLELFNNSQFGQMRTIVKEDGEVLFCGVDIAKSLGYANPSKAVVDNVNDEYKTTLPIREGGSNYQTNINFITEAGVYQLIFSSKLASADKFRRWVFEEVLPSIRKNGMYATEVTIERMLEDPDFAIRLLTQLKEEKQRNKELAAENTKLLTENKSMSERVSYLDIILECKECLKVTQIAQDYGMSAKAFNKLLHELKIQYRQGKQWIIYTAYVDKGWVKNRTYTYDKSDGTKDTSTITVWTQKGRCALYDILKEFGIRPLCEQDVDED